MHGIAALVEKLRADAGSWGMLTANGGFLTKHSVGIYSTRHYSETHPGQAWSRVDPSSYQQEVIAAGQAENTAVLAEAPEGAGIIEVFTVDHNRAGPISAIVAGTLVSGADEGKRFLAVSRDEATMLALMEDEQGYGMACSVVAKPNSRGSMLATFSLDSLGSSKL